MSVDKAALRAHEDWIGLVQPTGLVVSPVALLTAGAVVSKDVAVPQQALQQLVDMQRASSSATPAVDFTSLATGVLGWASTDLVSDAARLEAVSVPLTEWGETLRVTYVVPAPPAPDGTGTEKPANKPLLVVKVLPTGMDFDDTKAFADRQWQASAQGRFERILREADVPIGILFNGVALRLVYLPKGEVSGHMTFPIAALLEVANRPMLSALLLLLGEDRLFTLDQKFRLPALLANSRKAQNQVSTELSEQFLVALAELLRGFQAADRASNGQLLHDFRAGRGYSDVYAGLLSVLLRLVFVLYAEDRDLLPDEDVYREGYSVRRLYERLRNDADAWPDTMDQRYGAWAQLLALFRLIHSGASWPSSTGNVVRLPAREGRLFHPDSAPFLEGRSLDRRLQKGERVPPPRVSDGVVLRVLESLLLLDGQKLSYRTLDVEQIGSVYESLMGFTIDVAEGTSCAVLPHHVVVDLDDVLAKKSADRAAVFEAVKCKLTPKQLGELKAAASVDGVVKALGNKVSRRMPLLVAGSLFLQPTDERRRSGSHYTPRALTEPIVATALRPILERLDDEAVGAGKPGITPEQLLELKLCDPAMGSGAFLVQAGRQLGAHLVDAWARTNSTPRTIPPDETPLLHATRLVATRCLYGVDKNPLAVELAKLSLWLDTLAKDHPFTFLDHSLREGDSLVGLSVRNLRCFSWKADAQLQFTSSKIDTALIRAQTIREELEQMGDDGDDGKKREMHHRAEAALSDLRLIGDAVIAAFFSSTKGGEQKEARLRYLGLVQALLDSGQRNVLETAVEEVLRGERPLRPFHWEVEFPEVFSRDNGGFDVFVGNPPFAGKNSIFAASGETYVWNLSELFPGAHGGSDLVAYFYRQAFQCTRNGGTLALIATNTISQGDTRSTGIGWIAENGGFIYEAKRRIRWPGLASVIVSNVCIRKNERTKATLDGRPVEAISAFLFHRGSNTDPARLQGNRQRAFIGNYVLGEGFVFEDGAPKASSIAEMKKIVADDPHASARIFPFQGGEELNFRPDTTPTRYVINFADFSEQEARRWPLLMDVIERKVKPERLRLGDNSDARRRKSNWWRWGQYSHSLFSAISDRKYVLVNSGVSQHLAFAIQPANYVFAHTMTVLMGGVDLLSLVQARTHETWARFFASSLGDGLRYTPSDCFETFPFPCGWEQNAALEAIGQHYHDFRAALMITNNEGLTKTYNRFHDPDHDGSGVQGRDARDVVADIETLRALHDEMDRAVLDAYGWTDLRPTCEFLLDYEEEDDDDDDSGDSKKRKKKKPWRYRWPDDVRDEVLARLLELNKQYAEEEKAQHQESQLDKDVQFALQAPIAATKKKAAPKKPRAPKA